MNVSIIRDLNEGTLVVNFYDADDKVTSRLLRCSSEKASTLVELLYFFYNVVDYSIIGEKNET